MTEDRTVAVSTGVVRALVAILAVLMLGVGVLAIGFGTLNERAASNRDLIEQNQAHLDAIERAFVTQKVCTDIHREACPALFDRLAESLTAGQRLRLACDVMAALKQDPVIRRIRGESHCPTAIVPPRP